ncbi:hypothetical protein ACWT_5645 [Actinoplanes sp. SE50]|nr:hypothetical protein ACPL_5775 [Actinoplanes sp. SE50/110]ATO85060.1 hypothetical protein ACWT_5645 [Actinoplanes sp. SE50]SLM02471.1 hypothetical protein ACSP50_5721 [Actinoplanes sp. SE50/110]
MIDAIRDGDVEEARRFLTVISSGDRWEADIRAFGAAVLRHGGPGMAEMLFQDEVLPSGLWDDVDPVVWAADHGTCGFLDNLLHRHSVDETQLRRALEAARLWLEATPELELRRRAGIGVGEPVVIERDRVVIDDLSPRTPRLRLSALDGRRAEVLLAHRGVVTTLETTLSLPVSPDELLARALRSADPEAPDWSNVRRALQQRFSMADNVRWSIDRLGDPRVAVRRFTAELMHHLTLDGDGPDEPYAPQALNALHDRITVEPEPLVLDSLMGAYAGFRHIGDILVELLPFAGHPHPGVRTRVAMELLNGTGGPADDPPPHVLGVMFGLTRDPSAQVRGAATAELVYSRIDTPELRDHLAALLAGSDRRIRIQAATGLAMRGDPDALVQLRDLSAEDGYESHAWYDLDMVERMLGLSGL